jgi:hypothetical protein
LAADNVESSDEPELTCNSFSPFSLIITGPEGVSFALAKSSMITNSILINRKVETPSISNNPKPELSIIISAFFVR